MVCKEDVLLWFRDLESFKRIDVMFQLLNMCVPFELRFLGTCLEEIGKHSYQELRGSAITANDIDKLSKDASLSCGILNDGVRHRVLIYLSLLSGNNYKCAVWLYKTVLRTENVQTCVEKHNFKDEKAKAELLLLFTLALYHPAFTFEQKRYFTTMLEYVLNIKECRRNSSSKSYTGCPPGLGFVNLQRTPIAPEGIPLPSQTNSLPMCHCEPLQPQGIPIHQTHSQGSIAQNLNASEVLHAWNRPGFSGPISGAPEVAPFSQPSASTLVSQPASPTASRSTSPHKAMSFTGVAPTQTPLPQSQPPVIEMIPMYTAPVPHEQHSQSSISPLCSDHSLCQPTPDEKLRETNSANSLLVRANNFKPPNGIRLNTYNKLQLPFVVEQIQSLNLDGGENFVQCSSSNSSSTNSLNHSPPETPGVIPLVQSHQSPIKDEKGRHNSIPPPFVNPNISNVNMVPPNMCDTSTPPPPIPTANLNNCNVPYSTNYPTTQVTFAAIPNRSVFNYSQPYRPPFSAPYNYPHSELIYFPFIVSSAVSQIPQRTSNCYNCGGDGHNGADCTGQTIEEITQKKTYVLDYNPKLPEYDK